MAEEKQDLKPLQVEVCKPQPETEVPDKICPTCVPNPDFIEPDWWTQEAAFLNERTCEYWVAVTVNSRGRTYTTSDISGISDLQLKRIMKSYVRSGVILMLKHFDKLIADEVVCGAPPWIVTGKRQR